MFQRILVANRGEIALRVFRACREMGIETVAVCSAADRGADYLKAANESICIGPAAANQSYLVIKNIIAAAEIGNVQAIHPGYGFLSENEHFAEVCRECKIEFIGPSADAMAKLGDKVTAKEIAKAAQVNLVPGSDGLITSEAEALVVAEKIGYPVLIKATAGGGGKGMRVARNDISLKAGLKAAAMEAEKAFNNAGVYLEKYIENPRHVELQMLADHHGNVRHLFERDCSIQRRHQKVIEESPAPNVPRQAIAEIGQRAVEVLTRIGYDNIGTVEMLLGPDGKFSFLEMNTRLQVEHAVTEMVTGIDLVQAQIRAAAGHRLPDILPDTIPMEGHAIEVRIYAEDPKRFLPSPGPLNKFRLPVNTPTCRVDTGYAEGMTITPHYDPMLAKIIVRGTDRNDAIAGLLDVLGRTVIEGVKTNIPFLLACLDDARFRAGAVHTGLTGEIRLPA